MNISKDMNNLSTLLISTMILYFSKIVEKQECGYEILILGTK